MKRTILIFLSTFLLALPFWTGTSGCGSQTAAGTINPHFEDINDEAIPLTSALAPNNSDQVTVVEPGIDNQGAKIGSIADIDPARVLCIVIDPAAGDLADLEVCEAERVNTETQSADGLCPEADAVSRCASRNAGSSPDFCQVTGANDYAFILLNPSPEPVTVAFQVVDVTGSPNQSCEDLKIDENSIFADE